MTFLDFPQKFFQFSVMSNVVCLTFLLFKYCKQYLQKAGNAFRFLLRKLLWFLHLMSKRTVWFTIYYHSWYLTWRFYIFIGAKFRQFVFADHTPKPILLQQEYIHGMYTNLCKRAWHTVNQGEQESGQKGHPKSCIFACRFTWDTLSLANCATLQRAALVLVEAIKSKNSESVPHESHCTKSALNT